MSMIAETGPVSRPSLARGRALSCLVVAFLLFDGAIKLVPWPVVTEMMERMGYGSSETLARSLGFITIACTVLSAIPPASFVGAILFTVYLGGAIAAHLRTVSPLLTLVLFGLSFALMLSGSLSLRGVALPNHGANHA